MSLMRHVQRASIIAAGSALCLAGLIAPLASAEETPAPEATPVPEATSSPEPPPSVIEVGAITVSPGNVAFDYQTVTISGANCIGEDAEVYVYPTNLGDSEGLPIPVNDDGSWSFVVSDETGAIVQELLPGGTAEFGATCFVGASFGIYDPVTVTVLGASWGFEDPLLNNTGDDLPISGAGFTPDATITITISGNGIDPIVVGTATTDEDGVFASTFNIPNSLELGMYTLTIDDGAGLTYVYEEFSITPQPEEDPAPPVAPGMMPDLGTDIV